MKVLIGFEESQAVCIEFRKMGHEAYSCDLQECSGGHPEWHFQMDVFDAIKFLKWDFIGLHPVCTKMALSGNRTYAPGKPKYQERVDAVEWTVNLWNVVCANADKVYMENPMGAMNGDLRLPKPQIIQPYYFGEKYQKTTCLWLKNLPWLYHNKSVNLFDQVVTHVDRGDFYVSPTGRKMPVWYNKNNHPGNGNRQKSRSKTFPSIAKAIAEQWGI